MTDVKNLPRRWEPDVPLDSLEEFPKNPKDHDLGAIMESMKENGVFKGLLVQEWPDTPRYILAGHGTKKALIELGFTHIDCIFVECNPKIARKIVLADNRTSQLGGFRDELLLDYLRDVATDNDLAGTGYDEDDLHTLSAHVEGDHGEPDDDTGDSSVLKALSVTIDEPKHAVERGQKWNVGPHILICCDIIREHDQFTGFLTGTRLFCPFPSPLVALSKAGELRQLVLVQPDPFIAGHLLDRYADVHGKKSVSLLK